MDNLINQYTKALDDIKMHYSTFGQKSFDVQFKLLSTLPGLSLESGPLFYILQDYDCYYRDYYVNEEGTAFEYIRKIIRENVPKKTNFGKIRYYSTKMPYIFYRAMHESFYIKYTRCNIIMKVDPKVREVTFVASSFRSTVSYLLVSVGEGFVKITLDDLGKIWSFDKSELEVKTNDKSHK